MQKHSLAVPVEKSQQVGDGAEGSHARLLIDPRMLLRPVTHDPEIACQEILTTHFTRHTAISDTSAMSAEIPKTDTVLDALDQ